MRRKILGAPFFERATIEVCQELLGKSLVAAVDGREERQVIFEVEAYDGFEDKASHAAKGMTKRNRVMFESGGHIYVYLIYGMYWMLNLSTASKGYPSAILVRGAGDYDGPGKLTKALGIDRSYNGKRLGVQTGLWVEDSGVKVSSSEVERTPRIGISYAEEWTSVPYRFLWRRPGA